MINILILNIISFFFMFGVNMVQGINSAYLNSFGASAFIISASSSALYIMRGTSSVMMDRLSKRVSYKKLFIIAFIGSAVGDIIYSLPHNPSIIAMIRGMQGVFSGFFWVLINIYASSLGSKSFDKFKNLSHVNIFINIGGFLGSIIGGKLAAVYSPYMSFYTSAGILVVGGVIAFSLQDVENFKTTKGNVSKNVHVSSREKFIVSFAVLSSLVNSYISLGIPLYILELGGSYNEIGVSTGFAILSAAFVIAMAPYIKRRFSYRTIMTVDYILLLINLFSVFYLKSIWVIYFLQSILFGISALERNLWYSVLQDYSKNYNKLIGKLRGYVDYLGMTLFLIFGYFIQKFGSVWLAFIVGVIALIFLTMILTLKQLRFLRQQKAVRINGISQNAQSFQR